MNTSIIKKIILNTPNSKNELAWSYESALKSAKELYIASAYLTKWATNISLRPTCENVFFIIGTDFGITRKQACSDVINWLPKKFYGSFFAVPYNYLSGFHPKIVAWKDFKNKFHCIVGSSNLTEAAFSSNYEANIKISITETEFVKIKEWLEGINDLQVIDKDWLKHYKEASLKRKKGAEVIKRVVNLPIPKTSKYRGAILRRRKAEKTFALIDKPLKNEIRLCAKGKISSKQFWNNFWFLWTNSNCRIQGSGIQFTGKAANWKQACSSFLKVLENSTVLNDLSFDHLVKTEIDKLHENKNPMRAAWFSEMLCHYFPDKYPVSNSPIKIYLKKNGWKSQRGLTEGGKYIDLSKKLREVLRQNRSGPKNMPELDNVIWTWCNERGLLRSQQNHKG